MLKFMLKFGKFSRFLMATFQMFAIYRSFDSNNKFLSWFFLRRTAHLIKPVYIHHNFSIN